MKTKKRAHKIMDPDFSNGETSQTPISKEKLLVSRPVSAGSSGEGLPYAPEDWPCPGDKWRWKVGARASVSGFWRDRYLYPPHNLVKTKVPGGKLGFSSKLLVEQYIHKEFPNANIDTFFASFIWRIPCKGHNTGKDVVRSDSSSSFPDKLHLTEYSASKAKPEAGDCKAGNKTCSLQVRSRGNSLPAMECDICCSEAGFCHDCCCILCCRTIDWAYGGYSFIRCEAIVDKNHICGHVAHIECALRAYMAGTVGGSIGLDVEYYCRRCDNKTDLISHVTRLLHTCESPDSRDNIEKISNLALCILSGSQRMRAKSLRTRIESVIAKHRSEVSLGDVWEVEDNIPAISVGYTSHLGNGVTVLGTSDITSYQKSGDIERELEPSNGKEIVDGNYFRPVYITSDHNIASVKLEDEIDQVLKELKKSQDLEYGIAEQKLYGHKDFLLSLYKQLDAERSELANPTSSLSGGAADSLLDNVLNRVDQIKHEEAKLRQMVRISRGFGQAPKCILREHFGLLVDD